MHKELVDEAEELRAQHALGGAPAHREHRGDVRGGPAGLDDAGDRAGVVQVEVRVPARRRRREVEALLWLHGLRAARDECEDVLALRPERAWDVQVVNCGRRDGRAGGM